MARPQFFVGDPVPDFQCASSGNDKYYFDTVAGRYIVLCFFGSAANATTAGALAFLSGSLRHCFDDERIALFGVSVDRADRDRSRVRQMLPRIRFFWDFDCRVSRLYGAMAPEANAKSSALAYQPFTLVLDPTLRVLARIPLADLAQHNQRLEAILNALPPVELHAEVAMHAPVLIVPRVFEPALCRELIELFESRGGWESGSMIDRDGYTVGKIDHGFKRRKDCVIDDEAVRAAIRLRINRRLTPEIYKAFAFRVSRIERYIVACYDGEDGGFFRPHRDNTTRATTHRRFACTINLNAEDYEGGDLRFPEYGPRTYRAPTGGAVVFSCSLLHEATPVTRGRRYASLPFFYDDAAAQLRRENQKYLSDEVVDMSAQRRHPEN